MLTLTPRTRVADLAAGPPGLLGTLEATGLYRPGDDQNVTLGQLCWNYGFNPGILLMMLQSANVPEVVPAIADDGPYRAMSLDQLVGHIVTVHHDSLRQCLPRLVALADAVAGSADPGSPALRLRDEVHGLALELDAHLAHEEEALFPMVRDLATRGVAAPTRCGNSVGGPIACMENEHAGTARSLALLRELAGGYEALPDAGADWRELVAGLARLDQDLREHIYKEDHILFPRALEAQRGGGALRVPAGAGQPA